MDDLRRVDVEQALEMYLQKRRTDPNTSPLTVRTHRSHLDYFQEWLNDIIEAAEVVARRLVYMDWVTGERYEEIESLPLGVD